MDRENASDLLAFLAVAGERSFTRAAARLGVSQPTLSQTVRNLEERLGVRLLTRTTRSVAPTQAGERLFRTVAPRFEETDRELGLLSKLRQKLPAPSIMTRSGSARSTSSPRATTTCKLPLHLRKASLERLLARRPEGIFVNPFERGEIGPDLFGAACKMGLEGFVSKRRERPYQGASRSTGSRSKIASTRRWSG